MTEDLSFKKNNKILTVSIAAYNVEKTIECALDSLVKNIKKETLELLEIIVVNDGSKDKTETIVKKYESLYPDSIRLINKENGGWGSTVNVSVREAQGTYYRLLDGDDWFETENLTDYLEFLSTAEADIVLSPYLKVFSQNVIEENHHQEIGSGICTIGELYSDLDLCMHEIAVKTEVLRKNFADITENCFYTDNEYVFEVILAAKTIQRFGQKIYMYRLGEAGQSVGIDGLKKHHKDTIKVLEKIYGRYAGYLETNAATEIKSEAEDGDKCKQVKSELLKKRVIEITDLVYVAYLLKDTEEAKCELKSFDRDLQEKYPQIDRLMKRNKKIRMLRISAFCLYRLLSEQLNKRYMIITQ